VKRFLKWVGIGTGIIVVLVVVLVVAIALIANNGDGGQVTVKRDNPTPASQPVDMTVPMETRQIVLESIGASAGVLDAAISQDGEYISLVLVVGAAMNEQYARQLGENFVRQFKTMSQDDPPGKDVGTGMYNYIVKVVGSPGEQIIAQGAKVSFSDRISW